jgi:hypothetical protein
MQFLRALSKFVKKVGKKEKEKGGKQEKPNPS